jgi:hypothetical protein
MRILYTACADCAASFTYDTRGERPSRCAPCDERSKEMGMRPVVPQTPMPSGHDALERRPRDRAFDVVMGLLLLALLAYTAAAVIDAFAARCDAVGSCVVCSRPFGGDVVACGEVGR